MATTRFSLRALTACAALSTSFLALPAAAWEPSKPVEFVVPAGTGGGADQMARFIQGVVAKNKLMAQPIVVVNKSGGAGAEGFLDVKGRQGQSPQDSHYIVQPVHYAIGDRRAFQLARPDAGHHARARPVRPMGQRRVAVQDGQGLHRRSEGAAGQDLQDGWHRVEAGRSDHHGDAGKEPQARR